MIVECNSCEARVDAVEVADYVAHYPDGEGPVETITLLRCRRCDQPFLVSQEPYPDGSLSDPYVMYPVSRHQLSYLIQGPIRESFTEALSCFKSRAYTAAAIMCRRTLEGVCAEHQAKGDNLVAKLQDLNSRGIIESGLYQWADELRIAGNDAAHEVTKTVSKEDASDMIEFSHALVEYLFTYRNRFEEFQKRRGRTPGGAAP